MGHRGHPPVMKSIAFVMPYFGKWPFWFDFYLVSCQYNPSIHWIFYTDCGIPEKYPANVHFHEMSFEQYAQKVRDKLHIDFYPKTPYKLCDLRPAYGLIHAGDLKDYDFWGFGDIDVIYGDLRKYLTDERLRFNTISCIGSRISGHLSLFRNCDQMNLAFQKCSNWQTLMCGEHTAFDERGFSHLFIKRKNWPHWLSKLLYCWDPYVRGASFEELHASAPSHRIPWIDGTFNFPTEWKWHRGSLTNNFTDQREFAYWHFVEWKLHAWREISRSTLIHLPVNEIEQGFKVTADGFFPMGETQNNLFSMP